MKYHRNRSLLLVVAAADDVAAGRLTADAALHRLKIDLLHEIERRVYCYVQEKDGATTRAVAREFSMSLTDARQVLSHLVGVGLLETPGGAGHTRPYVYRVKGGGNGH
ncbi:MAG: hypothetical protein E6Q97_07175 [Desulfurellales bacterium]|nr:MAG: hypothetical protein E6Q97_07175 [Desulfurellales bacterium]